MATKNQIGNLLVGAGIIYVKTLERALELQQGSGKRLGKLLRDMGIVTEQEVIEALARQLQSEDSQEFCRSAVPEGVAGPCSCSNVPGENDFPLKTS